MSQSLRNRIEQVRTTATRLAWLYALSQVAAALLIAAIALGLLDYLLRPHDAFFRWLLFALAAGVTISAAWKFLLPAMSWRQSRVGVARRVESQFPQLAGRLSSAVAFLEQTVEDATAGSPDLRRAVIAEADAIAAGLDFRACLDQRPTKNAALVIAALVATAGFLALLNPAAASRATARLVMPWREVPWPRRHELAFVDPPERLAAGDDVELTLIDGRGMPPDRVELLLRYDSPAGSRVETKEMKPLGERMVLRLDNVMRSFAYRARGGDDDTMPWREVAVVEPPKVVDLQVLVQPPAYSGLPPQSAGRVAKALVGSQITVRGRLDKPIRSAIARGETADATLPTVSIGADEMSFFAGGPKAAWTLERPVTLWFELTDDQGLVFGRDTRVELQAVADSLPSITWEAPGDHSFVTARAVIPVHGIVKDDLALRGIQLRYLRPRLSDEEQVVELYVGQASHLPVNTASSGRGLEGESRTFRYDWDLSRLTGLAPGDVLAARITAEDFKPQLATTVVRRLTIITEEELADRIATRQSAILSQLAEALRAAQQSREQTSAISSRWQTAQQLDAGDLNQLQSVQHNQAQVQRLLGAGSEGAEGQIAALLGELAANHVENQAVGQRLSELLLAVRALNRTQLPAIEQELNEAIKSTREPFDAAGSASSPAAGQPVPPAAVQRLDAAGAKQDELIGTLEKLLGALNQWDSFSRLARAAAQIRDDQERLAAETEELRIRIVSAAEVAAVQRAAARQLAGRQQELARRLDKLQTRMEEMLARLTADDPLAAAALADALAMARRLAIGGQMREAATRLGNLQLGEARQTEQLILDRLRELLNSLSLRRDIELARTAAALRQAAGELSAIAQRGAKAKAEADAAATAAVGEMKKRELARLARTLEELRRDSEQLARRLARLRAPRAADSLDRAAGKAAAAAGSAAAGEADQTQQQAADAQQQLEDAVRELAQAAAMAEEELAREQLARSEQLIAGLAARQKNVIAETERLDAARDGTGNLGPELAAALRNVAAEELLLAGETGQLRPQKAAATAFDFALETAADAMQRAGGLLQRGQTGAEPKQAASAALTYLQQILEVLRPETPMPPPTSPPGGEQPQPGAAAPPANLAAAITELKLLKLLQEQLNRRTADLEARRAKDGSLTPESEQELAGLAAQQGKLADMTLRLIETTVARPEDNPEQTKPDGPPAKSLDAELLRGLEK